ncbi:MULTISPECIES: lactococcin 972 family bacteriocin [Streptomyces]|uniref:Lactococcin 972 family bacteriocin n=1 Tax=Streptomyces sudanensis TaxID=436397 RepID=A0ABY4TBH9_9ACTN|nr:MULTISPECIES: lactococcin 972 family bacteriocin [Streptomyces]URN15575.1 lactococcin 972 family bacteriocin [Streptomyces sudanensis]
MRKFGGMVFAATIALASGTFATPAAAGEAGVNPVMSSTVSVHTRGDGTQPPAELGDPKEWGVVELTLADLAESDVRPLTVVQVGGGTWSYGWQARNDMKYCYSNYYHGGVTHGSTVNMVGRIVKDVKPAGQTSNANYTAGLAYTCYTYYAKY